MKNFNIECAECGKKESFGDAKDITFAHWTILAWMVKTGEPVCVCEKCDYDPSNKSQKVTA